MSELFKNNQINMVGKITCMSEFSHEEYGEKFYRTLLASVRTSGTVDVLPAIISERVTDVNDLCGKHVSLSGRFHSYNLHLEDGKTKLLLYIFADRIEETDSDEENSCELKGYICKKPMFRRTPKGHDICDLILAVNRPYGKSDYIPCICWGRNAKFASQLEVGEYVQVSGRIQSREYMKRLADGAQEVRTAYELSVNIIKNEEEEVKCE